MKLLKLFRNILTALVVGAFIFLFVQAMTPAEAAEQSPTPPVQASALDLPDNTPAATTQPVVLLTVCASDTEDGGLNLRSGAGVEYAIIETLENGEQIGSSTAELRAADGGVWIHITWPVEGWVNSRYACYVNMQESAP